MTAIKTPLRLPETYTVAWICALSLEMAAAEAMLDERHSDLPTSPGDDNTYILGKMGFHNVIIACLPAGVYGTTSAAIVVSQMRLTFKNIRFGLMVGIAGGVPSKVHDIRLGDVVVSSPTGDSGGVIQYDYGKTVSGGRLERTGVLNKPPTVLLTAMARLKAAHISGKSRVVGFIAEMAAQNPDMREKFTYNRTREDLLFEVEYDHKHPAATCNDCDRDRLVIREERDQNGPVIHYGLIASGNQVIKDGRTRDQLARELGILCFEMEAAGLMDNFPCLVIRGICDYADCHKNKQWQEYAAATAAGYAKELLFKVHPVQLAETPSISSATDVIQTNQALTRSERSSTSLIPHNDDLDDEMLLSRISNYNHEKAHQRLSRKLLMGTAQWFLDHPYFNAWLVEKEFPRLWCSGKIGSGKTMIATAAVNEAKYRSTEHSAPVVFFYCDAERSDELNGFYILSSLIKQLCEYLIAKNRNYPDNVARMLKGFFGKRREIPDFEDLRGVFKKLFDYIPGTVYIIDGLDALSMKQSKELFELFGSLYPTSGSSSESRILIFSREQLPGYTSIPLFLAGIHQISTTSNVTPDLQTYIETSVTDKQMSRKLTDNATLLDEVKQTLLDESSGMYELFLWVYLQLEIIWQECFTDNQIRSALRDLPKDLEETYRRCVLRMNFTSPFAARALHWVSFAARPLHIEELREAVAFDLKDIEWDAGKIPQAAVVVGLCANLLVIDSCDSCVRFAHPSIKIYLQKDSSGLVPGYQGDDKHGNLRCGELCVAYLSFSNFNLQLVEPTEGTTVSNVPNPLQLAGGACKSFLGRLRFGKGAYSERPTALRFRQIRPVPGHDSGQFKFLAYAKTYWALQTKDIETISPVWKNFKQLSLSFSDTWNFHPWIASGRSEPSRFHGLFGWAVREEHLPLLQISLAHCPDIKHICNLPLPDERLPALHVASKHGLQEVVKLLLGVCQVNLQDEKGYTALHHAASKGHENIVMDLLSNSRNIKRDILSKTHITPFWLAASHGYIRILILLAKEPVSIETREISTGQTPLSQAARNGHQNVVTFLLDRGADLESTDASGRTPLSWAATNGHQEIIVLLLRQGANVVVKV